MLTLGKVHKYALSISLMIICLLCIVPFTSAQRVISNFNKNWKFTLTDDTRYTQVQLDDSDWQTLDVPHDWAFENGIHKEGAQGQGGGYHDGGIGWYRKTFDIGKESLDKTVYIEFDGVYMNSEVWINGNYLGKRPYGYISFRYDISKHLKAGKNVIAVRADNSLEPSARWYHPCGIYAAVRLIEVHPLHVAPNGIFITTPRIDPESALVNVSLELSGDEQRNVSIAHQVLDAKGKVVAFASAKQVNPDALKSSKMVVNQPSLWSPQSPTLYTLVTKVYSGKKVVDEVETRFGLKTIEWQTETGFWLNGENIKLKGVCEHWEGGPVAGAWTKPLLRWKLQLLKDMGINAIRPSHNPVPPMLLDICDEIGLLVMDEIFDGWHKKAPHDYGAQAFDAWWQKDMTEWITRDRNHASVFVWSLGNETHSDIAPELVKFGRSLDATRLFTSGSGNTEDMQIAGINGGSETQTFIETEQFDKPFISTEAPHTWQTRGHYRTQTWWRDNELDGTYPLPDLTEKEIFFNQWSDPKNWKNRKQQFNSSYDNATVRVSARKYWEVVRDNPWHSGNFRWTGFDYYGESGLAHGAWPFNLFMGGAADVAGFEKDLYYFYQSQWTDKPMVHILPHWTHPRMEKGTKVPVWVYSNADEVELFLNGHSLGKNQPGTVWNEMQCEWMVPYEEGTLLAVAYQDGQEVKRTSFETASQPSGLNNTVQRLAAEDGFETCFILSTEGVDDDGNMYPYAENKVFYSLRGDLELISLESGNPVDATSRANANYRAMFMGKTRAFITTKEEANTGSVVVGSILGDKPLYLSNMISIHAEEIFLLGNTDNKPLEIRYTVNGEDPARDGIVYQQPFEVQDGTTVKAIVSQDGEVLFTMSESFGEGQGMFWGDEQSEEIWVGRGITVAAEEAQLKGTAEPSSDGRRYKGDGFVVFKDGEGSITWYQENDGLDGDYNIRIRYTHDDQSSTRPMELWVNGQFIKTFEFAPTGSWETGWRFVNTVISYRPGANSIELKTTGQSGPHIDELFVD